MERPDLLAELELLPQRLEVREQLRDRGISLARGLLQRAADDVLQPGRHVARELRERNFMKIVSLASEVV